MKIKAARIKPGMVIRVSYNNNVKECCLVMAVSGHKSVEYTHISVNDFYGDVVVGTLDGNETVKVIKGKLRKLIIAQIRSDVYKHSFAINNIIDTINLIQSMDDMK